MYTFSGTVAHIYMRVCSFLPIQKKMVFSSYEGAYFNDNPRALYNSIKEMDSEYDYVWLMKDDTYKIPEARVVKFGSFKALYELATAKIWIDNCRKREWTIKRKGQYYVQMWHGDVALKKVEKDALDKLGEKYINAAKHDSEMADLFISGSKWRTKNYREAFWYTGEILECGVPKSDIFYKNPEMIRKKVTSFYQVSNDTKIALYAPTFRKDGKTECYNIDYKRLRECLEEKWGGNWKIFVRLHPNIQDKQDYLEYDDTVYNASKYSDMNELILGCDLLITDYSSSMFDGMEAGKKVVLYAIDKEKYLEERGVYWDFAELPFSLVQSNDELCEWIDRFSEEEYTASVRCFMGNVGFVNCANSAEKVADYILGKVTEK